MWAKNENSYVPVQTSCLQPALEKGVYSIRVPAMGPIYLEKIKEDFHFPYKVYGVNDGFVERVKKTFVNTTGNLGVLLNGIKGTGKSVTAELISNSFTAENVPTILISQRFNGLDEFLASIQQDIIVFVDEFEKVFKDNTAEYDQDRSEELLSLIDGALKSEHRRLFLFTTNEKNINSNLVSRPGRIRYTKEYQDLDLDTINELIDDILIHKQHKEEVINYISNLVIITIDIVKAIIQEVNIHNESPESFQDFFNASKKNDAWNLYIGALTADQIVFANPAYKKIESNMNPTNHSFKVNNVFRTNNGEVYFKITDINGLVVKGYPYDKETGNFDESKEVVYTFEAVKDYHQAYTTLLA